MEQEKNKNGVIALLVVIIVILLTLVVLFATGTISLKEKVVDTNESTQTNNNGTPQQLTEEEATVAIKSIFTNDTVQYLVDHISVTYCKRDTTNVSEKELGLDYQWNGYNRCTDLLTKGGIHGTGGTDRICR